VNLPLCAPWRYTEGSRGVAPLTLNLDVRCARVISFTPRFLYPWGKIFGFWWVWSWVPEPVVTQYSSKHHSVMTSWSCVHSKVRHWLSIPTGRLTLREEVGTVLTGWEALWAAAPSSRSVGYFLSLPGIETRIFARPARSHLSIPRQVPSFCTGMYVLDIYFAYFTGWLGIVNLRTKFC